MKPKLKHMRILFVALAFALYASLSAFYAMKVAPANVRIRQEEISSDRIPQALNDYSVLYFSDLDYGTFVNEKRLNNIVSMINEYHPDVVLFGGDVFDEQVMITDEMQSAVMNGFRQISAPYGKFAVLGDFDEASEERKTLVQNLLFQADFEVLNNKTVALHKQGAASISLVGLDNSINGTVDTDTAFSTVSRSSSYVITICHNPETATKITSDLTDYFLAGHTHGGQACLFSSCLYTPTGSGTYLRGKHTIASSFTLDITNGVGTTGKDIRFSAPQEVVLYSLRNQN